MNIIVANKNSSILNSLDIDIIKSLNGEFSIAEIVQLFSNFFFEKIIIDITAIKDIEEMVDLEEELRIPINFYEHIPNYYGEFTLIHNNIVYRYIIEEK